MTCINNIVAVSSVLNINNKRRAIIKQTVVPMAVYGIIAAVIMTVIPLFYGV